MRIEHVALWTSDLDRSKEFYTKFFGASSCPKYVNPIKKLETFFLNFDSGARLEIMRKPDLVSGPNDNQTSGWTHVALVVGTTEAVDRKAASLQKEGWLQEEPRWTGDGYYEAVAVDPDGNRIEIMAEERRVPTQT